MRQWELELEWAQARNSIKWSDFPSQYVQRALKEGVDWTADKRGVVREVKNQGPHGYCGTFGRIASVEAQYALRSGHPAVSFSESMMVDCVGWTGDQTASILGQGKYPGVMTEKSYPYVENYKGEKNPPIAQAPCKYDKSKVPPGFGGFSDEVHMHGVSEDQRAAWVHHNGPTPMGVDADMFKKKDSEHFVSREACKSGTKKVDHSVTVVGFGNHPSKGPYWKIKNSWGTNWGDKGYVYIARGVDCAGISKMGKSYIYGNAADYWKTSPQPSPSPTPTPPGPPPSPPSPSPSQCGTCTVCFNPTEHKCQVDGAHRPKTKKACEAKGHIWCGASSSEVYVV
jgi:hypothetical protein